MAYLDVLYFFDKYYMATHFIVRRVTRKVWDEIVLGVKVLALSVNSLSYHNRNSFRYEILHFYTPLH